MRRFLVSLGLAALVGGSVLGAAATLPLSTPPLSAADVNVTSCDTDGAAVYWSTDWNGSYFQVNYVYVQGLADACLNMDIEVVLTGGVTTLGIANNWSTPPKVVWDTYASDDNYARADFTSDDVHVAAVDGLHVQILNY